MVRLAAAIIFVLGLFAAACGGGADENPPPTQQGSTQTPSGQGLDLQAVAITLDDLPAGWELAPTSPPDSLSGFEHSYFAGMEREDGGTVRVGLISGTPESVEALRADVETSRQETFSAEVLPLDELIPGARKSVGAVPNVVDEAITFIVGPVLTTVWVSFPAGSEPEPSAEEIAKLVYDRILEQPR